MIEKVEIKSVFSSLITCAAVIAVVFIALAETFRPMMKCGPELLVAWSVCIALHLAFMCLVIFKKALRRKMISNALSPEDADDKVFYDHFEELNEVVPDYFKNRDDFYKWKDNEAFYIIKRKPMLESLLMRSDKLKSSIEAIDELIPDYYYDNPTAVTNEAEREKLVTKLNEIEKHLKTYAERYNEVKIKL